MKKSLVALLLAIVMMMTCVSALAVEGPNQDMSIFPLTDEKITAEMPAFEFSDRAVEMTLINKISAKAQKDTSMNQKEPKEGLRPEEEATGPLEPESVPKHGRSVDVLMERLQLLKN